MYNTNRPNREELPSTAKLIRSTIIAAIVALVLLVTVVMPASMRWTRPVPAGFWA